LVVHHLSCRNSSNSAIGARICYGLIRTSGIRDHLVRLCLLHLSSGCVAHGLYCIEWRAIWASDEKLCGVDVVSITSTRGNIFRGKLACLE
jgi:hypothetical protein